MTNLPDDLSEFKPYLLDHLYQKGIHCSTVYLNPSWCAVAPFWLDKLCGSGQVHFELIRTQTKSNSPFWEMHFEHDIAINLKHLDDICMTCYLNAPACEALRRFLREKLPNEQETSSQTTYWYDWYQSQLVDKTLTKRALRFNTAPITTVEEALQKFDEFYALIRRNLCDDFGKYKQYFNVDLHELLAQYK